MKPVPYRKRRAFFRQLVEGKAELEESLPDKRGGRRGKGKFSCFWVKDRVDSKAHWLVTFAFNQVFKRMIQQKQIKSKTFELCGLPLYFVAKETHPKAHLSSDIAVSHYVEGIDLSQPNAIIARKLEAPLKKVEALRIEMTVALYLVFLECKSSYPPIFYWFDSTSVHNVIVQSFDRKTSKFKVFVVDV